MLTNAVEFLQSSFDDSFHTQREVLNDIWPQCLTVSKSLCIVIQILINAAEFLQSSFDISFD
jgi:hypothetical protein